MMEKALIEQVQLAENSRMRFTRLGDVGKVRHLFSLMQFSMPKTKFIAQLFILDYAHSLENFGVSIFCLVWDHS